jgi:hypothetical protein
VLWKFRSAALKTNSVLPSGVDAPFLYFDTKPKVALPLTVVVMGPVITVLSIGRSWIS